MSALRETNEVVLARLLAQQICGPCLAGVVRGWSARGKDVHPPATALPMALRGVAGPDQAVDQIGKVEQRSDSAGYLRRMPHFSGTIPNATTFPTSHMAYCTRY